MSTDMFVMVLLTNLFTLTLSTMLYASRVYELRTEHQRRLAEVNHDYMTQRQVNIEEDS